MAVLLSLRALKINQRGLDSVNLLVSLRLVVTDGHHQRQQVGMIIGNFANEMTALYVGQVSTNIFFTDEAITEGIGPASRLLLKFGIFFFV